MQPRKTRLIGVSRAESRGLRRLYQFLSAYRARAQRTLLCCVSVRGRSTRARWRRKLGVPRGFDCTG
jgi:hypothetical protein